MIGEYEYFDEAYFQNGSTRGTVYNDYLNSAPQVPVYREIAEAVVKVFKPSRCLEIGCATGPIIRHLNEMGIEAHGIDPSDWAIRHRLHDRVVLAAAESLPYPDGHFDLVFSCHSLEHIPLHRKDAAFSELDRVCAGTQFHMLPILGESTFKGSTDVVKENLARDKSHHLLLNRAEWLASFANYGWVDTGVRLAFCNDPALELSICQFTLTKGTAALSEILGGAVSWNFSRFESLSDNSKKQRLAAERASVISVSEAESLSDGGTAPEQDFPGEWRDIGFDIHSIDLTGCKIRVVVSIGAAAPAALRIALLGKSLDSNEQGVLEVWNQYSPGVSSHEISVSDFKRLQGTPTLRQIDRALIGGSPVAKVRAVMSVIEESGKRLCYLSPQCHREKRLVHSS